MKLTIGGWKMVAGRSQCTTRAVWFREYTFMLVGVLLHTVETQQPQGDLKEMRKGEKYDKKNIFKKKINSNI